MEFLKSVASIAQNAIESINNPKHLTPDQLLRESFHLPESQHIINEISVQYRRKYTDSKDPRKMHQDFSDRASGKISITEDYLVLKKNDSADDKIVFHLAAIEKVQKMQTTDSVRFALCTKNGMILDIIADSIVSKAEYFWSHFTKQCNLNKPQLPQLIAFQKTLYSEYLVSKNRKTAPGARYVDISIQPEGGLGLKYKFPGSQSKEKETLRVWFSFFCRNGRNLELVKNRTFRNQILNGVPNRLRGEIWEFCFGAMYLRYENSKEYETMLSMNENKKSIAIEEIEKDLNRSLPEYAAFQTKEGIDKLRRVLTAYSWKNPEIGYCQAMNIVTAALLIFMTEEQAYWTLNVLCDKLIPGYYSKTMYGVLLDQKVLEVLVKNTMPHIGEHFEKYDIQLSIVSLTWFLSLFINTMPLVFAFRIMDAFFLNGPRALFQIALAIIKVNSHKLLKCTDDGECIAVFKEYFTGLDEVMPASHARQFDILWNVAFNEFSMIDDSVLDKKRKNFKNEIFEGIDLFVKRAEIRNLPDTRNLSKDQLSNIYDRYYMSLLYDKDAPNRGSLSMDFNSFKSFMGKMVPWVSLERNTGDQEKFLHRLYNNWSNADRNMTLETLVVGLNKLVDRDLMNALSNFFGLYDPDNTGKIPKETVLQLAEDLIYITTPWREGLIFDAITNREIEDKIAERLIERREKLEEQGVEISDEDVINLPSEVQFDQDKWKSKQSIRYLSASSSFLQLAFKYAQPYESPTATLISIEDEAENKSNRELKSISHNKALDPSYPVYITPSMFRMVILANDTYSGFFEDQFWKSFDLEKPNDDDNVLGHMVGNLRGMVNNFMADGARVATEVRKRMDSNRRGTLDSVASRSSSLTSSSGISSFSRGPGLRRSSIDSKGAESIATGITFDSNDLIDRFDETNLDDLYESGETRGFLDVGDDSKGAAAMTEENDEDDGFGDFVGADENEKRPTEAEQKPVADLLSL